MAGVVYTKTNRAHYNILQWGKNVPTRHFKGNFDLVVENDDIDQAVDKVVKSLIHWYPKIQAQQRNSTQGAG